MKIVCWNVHFDLTIIKYNHIIEFNADVYIFLECTKSSFDFLKDNWKYKCWYNDDLHYEDSPLGISILSNKYQIEFCDVFNRNFRYVVPYKIKYTNDIFLFVIWTKPIPFYYADNIIKALEDKNYTQYFEKETILIGDFNSATTLSENSIYTNILRKGFINTIDKEDEYRGTFFYKKNGKYFTNDYCLINKQMTDKYKVEVRIPKLNTRVQ